MRSRAGGTASLRPSGGRSEVDEGQMLCFFWFFLGGLKTENLNCNVYDLTRSQMSPDNQQWLNYKNKSCLCSVAIKQLEQKEKHSGATACKMLV